MSLSLRNRLKILIYFAAAVLFVAAFFDHGPKIGGVTIGRLAIVETAVAIIVSSFDRRLWRWRPVVWAFRTGPVLRGTWKGVVTNKDSGQPFEAYLRVRQTYSAIELRLMTAESTSDSKGCQLTAGPDDLATVDYVYENVPRPIVRDRSPIHFGAARIEAVGHRPHILEGAYWTDRRSAGEIKMTHHKRQLAQTFDDARKLFS